MDLRIQKSCINNKRRYPIFEAHTAGFSAAFPVRVWFALNGHNIEYSACSHA